MAPAATRRFKAGGFKTSYLACVTVVAWFAAVTVFAGVIASVSLVVAQGSTERAIDQAQRAVQERITSQQGGGDLTVQFARDVRTEFPSNAQVRVQGTGSVLRAADGRLRPSTLAATG